MDPNHDGENGAGRRVPTRKPSKKNLRSYAIYLIIFTALWLCGYMNISFAWIILSLGIAGVCGYRQEARRKLRWKKRVRMAGMGKEGNLPSWACTLEGPETAAWLNNLLTLMWPHVEQMARNIVKESVEPELQKNLPSSLNSLYFETVNLGRKPPYLTNIKTYSSNENPVKQSEFIIDMDLNYCGNAEIKVAVKRMHLGIADLQLRGPLRIILKPLLSDYSVIGGITVFFRKQPQLSFDLTNLLNILDFPGLKDTLRDIVDGVIANVAVLPNRIVVPLAGTVDVSELKYPMPEGVLQVELMEARDLANTDVSLMGKGSSDPYAVVKVGAQSFRSAVKNNDLNPVWNEIFEAFVDNCEGQDLEVAIHDKDISKDEILGSTEVNIAGIVREGEGDFWTPLEGVSQGQVHLRTTWFVLSESPLDLCPPEDHGSVAALFVKVKTAENLPPVATRVFCRVTVGGESRQTFETGGETPEWNQLLRFLLKDPFSQDIQIDVIHAKYGSKLLGRLTYSTKALIDETEMTFEDCFSLDGAKDSTLTCKFILRAFKAANLLTPSSRATKNETYGVIGDDVRGNDVTDHGVEGEDVDDRDVPSSANEEEDNDSYSPTWSETSTSSSSNRPEKKEEASPSGSLFCVNPPEFAQSKGEITLELSYSHQRNRLIVKVQRVTGLVLEAPKMKTNSYVRLYLLPDRSSRSLRKTYVFPCSKNPVFDEVFEYAIGLDQLRERRLEVMVKNNKTAVLPARGFKDVIGKAIVELSELNLTEGETLNREIRG